MFGIVVKEDGCGLILVSSLGFAAVALFAEGEVEVVAVEAEPVSFAGLGVALGETDEIFLDGGQVGLHFKLYKDNELI